MKEVGSKPGVKERGSYCATVSSVNAALRVEYGAYVNKRYLSGTTFIRPFPTIGEFDALHTGEINSRITR